MENTVEKPVVSESKHGSEASTHPLSRLLEKTEPDYSSILPLKIINPQANPVPDFTSPEFEEKLARSAEQINLPIALDEKRPTTIPPEQHYARLPVDSLPDFSSFKYPQDVNTQANPVSDFTSPESKNMLKENLEKINQPIKLDKYPVDPIIIAEAIKKNLEEQIELQAATKDPLTTLNPKTATVDIEAVNVKEPQKKPGVPKALQNAAKLVLSGAMTLSTWLGAASPPKTPQPVPDVAKGVDQVAQVVALQQGLPPLAQPDPKTKSLEISRIPPLPPQSKAIIKITKTGDVQMMVPAQSGKQVEGQSDTAGQEANTGHNHRTHSGEVLASEARVVQTVKDNNGDDRDRKRHGSSRQTGDSNTRTGSATVSQGRHYKHKEQHPEKDENISHNRNSVRQGHGKQDTGEVGHTTPSETAAITNAIHAEPAVDTPDPYKKLLSELRNVQAQRMQAAAMQQKVPVNPEKGLDKTFLEKLKTNSPQVRGRG